MGMEELLKRFEVSDEHISELYDIFNDELNAGLAGRMSAHSVLKLIPTFVRQLPTGEESGQYLALDFRRKDVHIFLVTLKPGSPPEVDTEKHPLPNSVYTTGQQLFQEIAEHVTNFLKARKLTETRLLLGFTFPFPCEHHSLSDAKLIKWTKEIDYTEVVNQNVCAMLQSALVRAGSKNVELVALLNDTTEVLLECAYEHSDCRIGVLIDEGTNACYVEDMKNMKKLMPKPRDSLDKGIMLINCEWAALGDSGNIEYLRTAYDHAVDNICIDKGFHLFEKMVGEVYLANLVRTVLLYATQQQLIFTAVDKPTELLQLLSQKDDFLSWSQLAEINVTDVTSVERSIQLFLSYVPVNVMTREDCRKLKLIIDAVAKRASQLIATVLTVLINRVSGHNVVIAIAGCVFQDRDVFYNYMHNIMHKLLVKEKTVEFVVPSGTGIGAAIAIATLQK